MSDDLVAACPDCGSSRVTGNATASRNPDQSRGRFRCTGCGQFFDEPNQRERQRDCKSRKGLAGQLVDADPDEVGP